MRTPFVMFLILFFWNVCAYGATNLVTIKPPDGAAWVGQRVAFHVGLRAPGSFAGTPVFNIPVIPGTIIMKIGSPLQGTEEIDGESWLTQSHEFALFSQQAGELVIPAFEVIFSSRQGYTGPAEEKKEQVPGFTVTISRPPGSEELGFIISTQSLDVKETWDPQPGAAQAGAVFKRTIRQQATQVSGMALAAYSEDAPEGIRVYPGDAEVTDSFERGDFLGKRDETITYLVQKEGSFTLPARVYSWWNPETETIQSTTLPTVTFDVAAPPVSEAGTKATQRNYLLFCLPFAAIFMLFLAIRQRHRLAVLFGRMWRIINPPERRVARRLRRACRNDNSHEAETAWNGWCTAKPAGLQPSPELSSAIMNLQRHLYGPPPQHSWQGNDLLDAFDELLKTSRSSKIKPRSSVLPSLNP